MYLYLYLYMYVLIVLIYIIQNVMQYFRTQIIAAEVWFLQRVHPHKIPRQLDLLSYPE